MLEIKSVLCRRFYIVLFFNPVMSSHYNHSMTIFLILYILLLWFLCRTGKIILLLNAQREVFLVYTYPNTLQVSVSELNYECHLYIQAEVTFRV